MFIISDASQLHEYRSTQSKERIYSIKTLRSFQKQTNAWNCTGVFVGFIQFFLAWTVEIDTSF